MLQALRNNWPEYLMEAWGLGFYVAMACLASTAIWHPASPIEQSLRDHQMAQRLLLGLALGLTAITIVYSPWGKRSGAHINPAITLTFFRLGKIGFFDAVFYIAFQFLGAILGAALCWFLLCKLVSVPEINFAVTVPGTQGMWGAFLAELAISAGVMSTVLIATNRTRLSRYAGLMVGSLLVVYITFESPLSGMSMNPARTVGSAVAANVWTGIWIYLMAPLAGMLLAAEFYLWTVGKDAIHCAKLYHTHDVRCIFNCGYRDSTNCEST